MFYKYFYGLCIKTAFRYVDTYPQAVEVTDNAFIKMFRDLPHFEGLGKEGADSFLTTWIKRTVIGVAIEYMHSETDNIPPYPAPDCIWEQDDDASSDNVWLYRDLIAMVKELPPSYQKVFNLYVVDGYSHLEIASMLMVTTSTSRFILSKAKAHVEKALITHKSLKIIIYGEE